MSLSCNCQTLSGSLDNLNRAEMERKACLAQSIASTAEMKRTQVRKKKQVGHSGEIIAR